MENTYHHSSTCKYYYLKAYHLSIHPLRQQKLLLPRAHLLEAQQGCCVVPDELSPFSSFPFMPQSALHSQQSLYYSNIRVSKWTHSNVTGKTTHFFSDS